MRLALVLACFIGVLGAFACARFGLAFPGRLKPNAGASGLGEPDSDRLFRRPGPMLTAANLVNFLANEFAGLGRGRLSLTLVFKRSLDCSLVWHRYSPAGPGETYACKAELPTFAYAYQRRRNQIDPQGSRSEAAYPNSDSPTPPMDVVEDWRNLL
jgi:hypothetical protein